MCVLGRARQLTYMTRPMRTRVATDPLRPDYTGLHRKTKRGRGAGMMIAFRVSFLTRRKDTDRRIFS